MEYADDTGRRGRGHAYRGRGRGRGRGRSAFNKSIVECYHFHDLGHFQYECPKKDKESRAHLAETSEEMLLMAYIDVQKEPSKEAWFLDSGCSNHMGGKKEFFNTLNEDFRDSVKLGNNTYLNVMGRGSIRMQIGDVTHIITKAYYVPQLKKNLLSIGQLQEKGLAILIQNNMCKIYHPERGLIMQTNMSQNRMFIFLLKIQSSQWFHSITDNLDYLWHCQYGHLSFGGLKKLYRK